MGHGMWSQPSTDSENRAMAFTTMFAMSGAASISLLLGSTLADSRIMRLSRLAETRPLAAGRACVGALSGRSDALKARLSATLKVKGWRTCLRVSR